MSALPPSAKDGLEEKRKREEEEREDIRIKARDIVGYEEWRARTLEVFNDKKRREEAFDLVFALVSKFRSLSLFQLSLILGKSKRTSGKVLGRWKREGKVLLLTEQHQGHPYKIIIKE